MSQSDGPISEEPLATAPGGCLVAAVRVPARVVAVLVVVPLRFAWELLVALARPLLRAVRVTGRALDRAVRTVLNAVVVVPLCWVWRRLLLPVVRALAEVVRGVARRIARWTGWVVRWVVVRGGGRLLRALAWSVRWCKEALEFALPKLGEAVGWLVGVLLLVPLSWVYRGLLRPLGPLLLALLRLVNRWVLRPVGRALTAVVGALDRAVGWLVEVLLPTAVKLLYRWVIRPLAAAAAALGRGLVRLAGAALMGLAAVLKRAVRLVGLAARLLGRLLDALWRWVLRPVLLGLDWLLERLVARPLGWAWRLGGRMWRYLVLRPCRRLRREVWWPVKAELRRAWQAAAATVRETVREVRRALFG